MDTLSELDEMIKNNPEVLGLIEDLGLVVTIPD